MFSTFKHDAAICALVSAAIFAAATPALSQGPSEAQREVFDLANRILRECEDSVLLGVGRQDEAVVAGEVRGCEVARERHAYGHVLDVMESACPRDADDVRLRLPVLVVPETDRHVPR